DLCTTEARPAVRPARQAAIRSSRTSRIPTPLLIRAGRGVAGAGTFVAPAGWSPPLHCHGYPPPVLAHHVQQLFEGSQRMPGHEGVHMLQGHSDPALHGLVPFLAGV